MMSLAQGALVWCTVVFGLAAVVFVVLVSMILMARIVLEAEPRIIRAALAVLYAGALFWQFIWVWNPAALFAAFERSLLASDAAAGAAHNQALDAVSDYFWGVVIAFLGAFAAAGEMVAQSAASRYYRALIRGLALAVVIASFVFLIVGLREVLPFYLYPEGWVPAVAVIALPLIISWLPSERLRVFPESGSRSLA
ncbi:hypothetical protein MUN78_11495 [Leucobacter allii]|uniref:DUF4386 family protein n=1 Tax=Leucobacter allii TaxID=2932247 RepID=A0ABY4FJS8_9MICO|nr:hypothetical protein [Leucobacter allii]UOQ56307.1 hypothetical protein MUN78_11495 [Leucobacter allii]